MTTGSRFLGIDYGTKRIGLAYGDDIGIAVPLPAVVNREEAKRWSSLIAVVNERRITDIVIGLPLNMDGTAGPKAAEAEAVASRLKAETGLKVHLVDERLTSFEAESTIPPAKLRSLRKSGIIDSRSAALILQDFIEVRMRGRRPSELA